MRDRLMLLYGKLLPKLVIVVPVLFLLLFGSLMLVRVPLNSVGGPIQGDELVKDKPSECGAVSGSKVAFSQIGRAHV